MHEKKRVFSFFNVACIVITTSLIMCFLGGILVYKHLSGDYSADNQYLKEFISTYNELVDNYYDELDEEALIDSAINGLYDAVDDPYTTYLDDDSSYALNSSLSGSYQGIGIGIGTDENDNIIIAIVYDDTPADNAGLAVGDTILTINGEDATLLTTSEISSIIKASEKVELEIERNSEILSFTISVENLYVPVVTTEILEKDGKKVGYIYLSVFNDTSDVQFLAGLTALEDAGIEALIIDLRGNSGGYLQMAENIAEAFLSKGKLIYSLQNKDDTTDYYDETDEKRTYPVAVLINGTTASASEILSAALKYSYGATLVGQTSYGKGKVQEKVTLSDGTSVKYTSAKWLTPKGDCIDGTGLIPDIEIAKDTETYINGDITTDTQVISALNSLID